MLPYLLYLLTLNILTMVIYGVYKNFQNYDSDGWWYWKDEELIKLFTEEHNAETFINELLIKDHDEYLSREHYEISLEKVKHRAIMILNNEEEFTIGTNDDIEIDSIYFIKSILVEECPSLQLNSLSAD